MFQRALLTDGDVEQIRDAALQTLETAGMMFQSDVFLTALEKKGASVDRPKERAMIPRSLVLEVIEAEAKAAAKPPDTDVPELPSPGLPQVGGQVAQLLYDYDQTAARHPTREDFIRTIQFGEALHGDSGVGHVLIMHDVPQQIEPFEAQALLIEHTRKPRGTVLYYGEQIDYAAEMGEIYCGDRQRFSAGGVFLTSPLRLCRRACGLMARKIELGFNATASTMPVAGASVPATLAGAVTVAAAEILGAWTAYRALREDVSVSSGIAAGAVDMRTGAVSFCSPEAMLLNIGTVEFFRRLCGKPIGVAGASDYCNTKVPGLRAAMEKAHKVMTVAAFTGRHGGVGSGMVDAGKIFSPEQLIIERDVTAAVARLFRPIETNESTIALDSILTVGQGIGTTHFETEHTLEHYREALWSTDFPGMDTSTADHMDFDVERKILDKAHEVYEDTLTTYEPPEPDPDTLRAIRAVVEKARRDLADRDVV